MQITNIPQVDIEVRLGPDIKPFTLSPSMLNVDPETVEQDLATLPGVIATIGTVRALAAKKAAILETSRIPREMGRAVDRAEAEFLQTRNKVSDTHIRKVAETDREVAKLKKELAEMKHLQSVLDSYYFGALAAKEAALALLPRMR